MAHSEPTRLPAAIVSVIEASSLCYLATVSPTDPGPHLSAMTFSLQDDPEMGHILVMSTRRDTRKFAAIANNDNVAVLLHDFDGRREPDGGGPTSRGTLAVTVYGRALLQSGVAAERMRAAHLLRNASSPQFIADAATYDVFAVVPSSITCCDVQDKVYSWEALVASKPGDAELEGGARPAGSVRHDSS